MKAFLILGAFLLAISASAQELSPEVTSIKGILGCYESETGIPGVPGPRMVISEKTPNCESNGVGNCKRSIDMMAGEEVMATYRVDMMAQNPAIGIAFISYPGLLVNWIEQAAYDSNGSVEKFVLRQWISPSAFGERVSYVRCK